MRFFLGLGMIISLFCYSVLRQQMVLGYEYAILLSSTLAALAFDYRKVSQFLTVVKEKEESRCSHDLAIRAALTNTVKSPFFLRLLEPAILTLYYAFFAKFERDGVRSKNTLFSYAKSSNAHDIFLFVAISQLPFLPFIHVFLEHEGEPGLAWVITLLTLWSVIWYLAQVEAAKFRPIELSNGQLKYRFGLFWTADIPLSKIKIARSVDVTETLDRDNIFLSPLGSTKNVILEFESPTRFSGPYMLKRCARKAAISLDNPTHFLDQLALRGVVTG